MYTEYRFCCVKKRSVKVLCFSLKLFFSGVCEIMPFGVGLCVYLM